MVDVDSVETVLGLKDEFLKRHRKGRGRAEDAWDALVRLGAELRVDPFRGTQIPKQRFPRPFARHPNLWKLDLPHAFRAVYTVIGRPHGGVRVRIEWIGDHGEYDALFGYR